MAEYMLPISVRADKIDSIEQIKKACIKFKISFSALVVDLAIIGFETGKWGILLDKKHKKNVYTTADIVHDSMQDELTGNERWIKIWAILENVKPAEKLLFVKESSAKFVKLAKKKRD